MSAIQKVGTVTERMAVAPPPPPTGPQLKLFPQKVQQEATVRAIFAID
jgi:hypothetical protein